ncbi:hypothetical protein DRP77_12475, partial [Candidatus Poribacteria bacterium]
VEFERLTFRALADPKRAIRGVGAIADEATRTRYRLREEGEVIPVDATPSRKGPFYVIELEGEDVTRLLQAAAPAWVEEVMG